MHGINEKNEQSGSEFQFPTPTEASENLGLNDLGANETIDNILQDKGTEGEETMKSEAESEKKDVVKEKTEPAPKKKTRKKESRSTGLLGLLPDDGSGPGMNMPASRLSCSTARRISTCQQLDLSVARHRNLDRGRLRWK